MSSSGPLKQHSTCRYLKQYQTPSYLSTFTSSRYHSIRIEFSITSLGHTGRFCTRFGTRFGTNAGGVVANREIPGYFTNYRVADIKYCMYCTVQKRMAEVPSTEVEYLRHLATVPTLASS